jgi:phospholipase C
MLVLAVAAAVTSAAATKAQGASAASASAGGSAAGMPGTPIRHVIEIMIENHTFDNLFGRFPGADGIPANASFLSASAYFDSAPSVSPVYATPGEGDAQGSISNSRVAGQMAMDYVPGKGYQMGHYTSFPEDGMSAITEFGPGFDPSEQYLARNFELADHNFQPVIAPTQPNVMTALNGTIWDQIIPSGERAGLTTGDQFFTDLADGSLISSALRPRRAACRSTTRSTARSR